MGTPASLAQQRCFIHPWREAAVRCPACQRFFCRECSTEHEGRLLCTQCLARITAASAAAKQGGPFRAILGVAGWAAAAIAGLLLAWLVFFYLGAALARTSFDFHTGG